MTFFNGAEKQVKEFEDDRRSGAASVRAAKAGFGVRTLESILLAQVGTTIATDPTKLRGADDEVAQETGAYRGIILEICAGKANTGTGEVLTEAGFRIYEPFKPFHEAFRFITEEQADLATVEVTSGRSLTVAIRRFCRPIADGSSALLTGYEGRLLRDAFHLSAQQLGGNLHA